MDTLDRQRIRMADDAERLADQAQSLKGGLAEDARAAAERAKNDTRTTLQELKRDARGVVTGAKQDTKSMAKERARAASKAVNPRRIAAEQPLVGFFGAAAIGYLIARIMPYKKTSPRYTGVVTGSPDELGQFLSDYGIDEGMGDIP
jgi:hypothetical protein